MYKLVGGERHHVSPPTPKLVGGNPPPPISGAYALVQGPLAYGPLTVRAPTNENLVAPLGNIPPYPLTNSRLFSHVLL